MKFKKILIIFLCVALLAAFSVSCFATSQESYGFYISPGEYVFGEILPFTPTMNFDFRFTNISDSRIFNSFQIYSSGSNTGFYFRVLSDSQIIYSLQVASFSGSFEWVDNDYRYITVLDGFYIYDINQFQWWQSNVTRVSPGYNSSFFDNMLSIFTAIGQWISGAAANLTSMFFVDNSLTFVGTLSVASLAMAVAFLIIALISRFLRFKA